MSNLLRIEPYNEEPDFAKTARACIKDPLFTIGRQWQLGEFRGWNGGSIINSKIHYKSLALHVKGNSSLPPIEKCINESEPNDLPTNWVKEDLEYHFQLEDSSDSQGHPILSAKTTGEDIDWYSFKCNMDESELDGKNWSEGSDKGEDSSILSLKYKGMPESRWWALEDRRVDIAAIRRPYINPLTMAGVQFLTQVPLKNIHIIKIPTNLNSLTCVNGIILEDSFGNKIEKKPYILDDDKSLFRISTLDQKNLANNYFIFPYSMKKYASSSDILEEVVFKVDHISNFMWAVETKSYDYAMEQYRIIDSYLLNNTLSDELLRNILKTQGFRVFNEGEESHMKSNIQTSESNESIYPQKLKVFPDSRSNYIPFTKDNVNGNYRRAKLFGSPDTDIVTKFLINTDNIKIVKIPDYEIKIISRNYLSFDIEGKPHSWQSIEKRLADNIEINGGLWDQLE